MNEIPRTVVLNAALDSLLYASQWYSDHDSIHNAAEYLYKAEALIETLEVIDCGSIGGYDRKNPVIETHVYGLVNRFLTVMKKHNTQAKDLNKEAPDRLRTVLARFSAIARVS